MIFTPKQMLLGLALASALVVRADAPTAHAYQMGDKSSRYGYVSFPVNDVAAKTMDKTTSSYTDQLGAADYVDGKLYGFTLEMDDFGAINSVDYVVLDPAANFKQDKSVSKYYDNRVVDMTYDYTTNRMYALIELKPSTSKLVKTALHVVDLNTGDTYLVGLPGDLKALDGYGRETEETLVTLAASPAGELYAVGDYRQLYKVDKLTGEATKVGEAHKVAITNSFQTMSFAGDGNLYYAQCHPDHEYFMRIDPTDGKLYNPVTGEAVVVNSDFTNNACRIADDPQLTSLYFTDKQTDADAPQAVGSLKSTLRAGTPNTVDLAWTLPQANSAVTAVHVYRFGTADVLATLPADAVSYTDENAPNGDVVYTVVAVSGEHIGKPAYTQVMAGADQLKAVGDLKAELEDMVVTLTWTAPTATVNGGYADFDNITYIVTMVSGSERTKLGEVANATTFDYDLTKGGTYTFEVVPVSCGIEGVAAVSNEVTVALSFTIPYFTGFEDAEDGTLWTAKNKSTGTNGWSVIAGYAYQQFNGKFAQFKTGGSATIPADDWLISPTIYFEPGEYELTYYANGASFDNHTYQVTLGTDPENMESFNLIIEDVVDTKIYSEATDAVNHYVERKATFTVTEAGDYHVGLHGIGCATFATLKIDNLSIVKLAPSFKIPYNTGFEDDQDAELWTILNTSTGSYGWSVISGYAYQRYDGKFAQFKTGGSATIPADDWMISPAIAFEAGDYVLSYYAAGGSFDTHKYDVALGTDATDPATFSQVIESVDNEKVHSTEADAVNNYAKRTAKFTVAEPGKYHLGFHGIGCATFATLKIDNLSIDKDQSAGIADVIGDESAATVTVVAIDGRVIMRDAAPEALGSLQPGIYIVNGRKVCIAK